MKSETINKILAVLAAVSAVVIGIGLIDKEGADLIIAGVSAVLMAVASFVAFKTGNGTLNDLKTNLLAVVSGVVLILEYYGGNIGWNEVVVLIINAVFSVVAILTNKNKEEDVDALVQEVEKRSLNEAVKSKL